MRKSGWCIQTYIHLYHCHHYDKLHDYKSKIGWYQDTYIHVFHQPQTLYDLRHHRYHFNYYGGRKSVWSLKTDIQ